MSKIGSRIRADRRVGLLLGGILLLTFVAIGATVALPASDPSLQVKAHKLTVAEMRGLKVYQSQGCWYCHTQYKRSTATDGNKATKATAFPDGAPSMMGLERVGPDLRLLSTSDLAKYLKKAHGPMPSYDFLSKKDLDALAAYLSSMR